MTNRIIQTAIERATFSATKETLTLVLTSLAYSQAAGFSLDEAVKQLTLDIGGRYGLERDYLDALVIEEVRRLTMANPSLREGAENETR